VTTKIVSGLTIQVIMYVAILAIYIQPSAVKAEVSCNQAELSAALTQSFVVEVTNSGSSGPCNLTYLVYDMHGKNSTKEGPFDLYSLKADVISPFQKKVIDLDRTYDMQCKAYVVVLVNWNAQPLSQLTETIKYPDVNIIGKPMVRGEKSCAVLASASTPVATSIPYDVDSPVNKNGNTGSNTIIVTGDQPTAVLPEKTAAPLPPNTGTNRLSKKGSNQKIVFGAGAMTLAGALAALSYKRRVR